MRTKAFDSKRIFSIQIWAFTNILYIELSLCHNRKFSNSYISLQPDGVLGCKDIWDRKSEFVAKIEMIYSYKHGQEKTVQSSLMADPLHD